MSSLAPLLLVLCLFSIPVLVLVGVSALLKKSNPQHKKTAPQEVAPRVPPFKTKELRNGRGEYHCVDGPAVEWSSGDKEWWIDGKRHRTDGPAREYNGSQSWWINGRLHRDDGPAKLYYGRKCWFFHGKIHRNGGPAIEYPDGSTRWYRYGYLHRIDGPAIDQASPAEHLAYLARKEWWQRGKRHREDGPAVERSDGASQWWIRGCRLSGEQLFAWRKTGKIINPQKHTEIYFWRLLAADDPVYWDLGTDARIEEVLGKLSTKQIENTRRRVQKWRAAHPA